MPTPPISGAGQRVRAPSRRRLAMAPAALAALVPLALTGCEPGLLDPAGPVGSAEKSILLDSLAIMLCIIVPTILATLSFAWWFRASNARARRRPEFTYSGRIELVTWSIPLLTITLLGGVAWISSHDLDPGRPLASGASGTEAPTLDVQVVALDWKWLFIYPGQRVASVNELVIPAGAPVRFSITSASVMNTFFVPRLGSMIYAMNGMATQLNLRADAPGTFHGLSGHYSGDGFSDMHFDVRAVPADQFDAWVGQARRSGKTLDRDSYAELAKQSRRLAPFTYGEADADLFQLVVTQAVPPGPGPHLDDPAATPKAVPPSEHAHAG